MDLKKNNQKMKKFYDEIAHKYDYIFPLTELQKNFLDTEVKGKDVLDVGAATGKVSEYLSKRGFYVYSIDINEKLIEIAASKGIKVVRENMLNIDKLENFDTIINIGNTLPHLNSFKEVYDFFLKAYKKLNDDGVIIIQLINFTKYTSFKNNDNFLGSLPLIENEHIKFERKYYLNEENNILFRTILDNKIKNEEILLNINYKKIIEYIKKIGYKSLRIYGGFDKSKFNYKKSIFFIIIAKK